MGTLTLDYPQPTGADDKLTPFCAHDWSDAIDDYTDDEHVLIVGHGGRPGYVAATIGGASDEELAAWIHAAKADGFRRFSVEGCGYGRLVPEDRIEQEQKRLQSLLEGGESC